MHMESCAIKVDIIIYWYQTKEKDNKGTNWQQCCIISLIIKATTRDTWPARTPWPQTKKELPQRHTVAEATSPAPACSRQSLPHFPAPTSFGVHGAPGHQTAFHQCVGVVAHDLAILTGPWLAFVSVHHQVLRPGNRTAPRQIAVYIYMSLANTYPCICVYIRRSYTSYLQGWG